MKPFTLLAALIFLAAAAAHAYRVHTGWAIVAGPYDIPMRASYFGMIVPLILAIMLFRESGSWKNAGSSPIHHAMDRQTSCAVCDGLELADVPRRSPAAARKALLSPGDRADLAALQPIPFP